MANAVFTISDSSKYDDQPEVRYQFPSTYLNAVTSAVGDWIVYYEPRRTTGPSSTTGRLAYIAIARLTHVETDRTKSGQHYAYVSDYLEFDSAVPFRSRGRYMESALIKSDGSTNKGAFRRAVRSLPKPEFEAILAMGLSRSPKAWEIEDRDAGMLPDIASRPIVEQIVSRRYRDEAFRRHVREAYRNTCAITGLQLTNGGGRPEVQAAHIRPVECDGPDTVRNGLALTATVHWMFDRGIVSVSDDYRVLVSGSGVPKELAQFVQAGRPVRLPDRTESWPHRAYLRWHRDLRFKS
jgi:putative restriction endonuclease